MANYTLSEITVIAVLFFIVGVFYGVHHRKENKTPPPQEEKQETKCDPVIHIHYLDKSMCRTPT